MTISDEIKLVLDYQTFYTAETSERSYLNPTTFVVGLPVYFAVGRWKRYNFGYVGNSEGLSYETTVLPLVGDTVNVNSSNVYDAKKIGLCAEIMKQFYRLGTPSKTGPYRESVYRIVKNFLPGIENDQNKILNAFRGGARIRSGSF